MTPPNAYGPRPRAVADTFQQAPAQPPAEKKINTTFWTPMNVHRRLKLIAAENDTTISALLTEGAQMVIDKYTKE